MLGTVRLAVGKAEVLFQPLIDALPRSRVRRFEKDNAASAALDAGSAALGLPDDAVTLPFQDDATALIFALHVVIDVVRILRRPLAGRAACELDDFRRRIDGRPPGPGH